MLAKWPPKPPLPDPESEGPKQKSGVQSLARFMVLGWRIGGDGEGLLGVAAG